MIQSNDRFNIASRMLGECEELFNLSFERIKDLTTDEFYGLEDILKQVGQIAGNPKMFEAMIGSFYRQRDLDARAKAEGQDGLFFYTKEQVICMYQCSQEYYLRYGKVDKVKLGWKMRIMKKKEM